MDNLKKVTFEVNESHWHSEAVENVWAEPIVRGNRSVFIIRNTPFFMKNISFLDTVSVIEHKDIEGALLFSSVVERSGHSTYRILVDPQSTEFGAYWKKLGYLECTYESSEYAMSTGIKMLYAVDVPAATDVHAVYDILEVGEKKGVWVFEEAHCGHL